MPLPRKHFLTLPSLFPSLLLLCKYHGFIFCKDAEKMLSLVPDSKKENLFLWENFTGIEDEIPNAVKEKEAAGHEMMKEMCCPAEREREGMKRGQ